MKILISIADLQPENGGPSRSVSALAAALAANGTDVELITLEYGPGFSRPLLPPASVVCHIISCRGWLAQKLRWSSAFATTLHNRCSGRKEVILHDNGIWLPTNHMVSKVARSSGVPLVVTPRGILTKWAMRYKGFKKRIAWHLYQRRDLEAAAVLHATSQDEANDLRALGLRQPIAIIPNGVTFPPPPSYGGVRSRPIEVSGQSSVVSGRVVRTALFLSRIHPKKGLLNLVEAWNVVRPPGWRVVIAGGDDSGHRTEVESALSACGLVDQFEFIGEVPDDKKWDLYRSADLFVLPTKSENFGIVIAEALACGLPVITTKGAPWSELETHRCGWWTDIGVEPLAGALREAIRLTDEQRHEMGARGRQLVEQNYTWPAAAKQMINVYKWLLRQGPKPDCVQTV